MKNKHKLACPCRYCRTSLSGRWAFKLILAVAASIMATTIMAFFIPMVLDKAENQRVEQARSICIQGYHCDPKAGP